MKNNKTMDLNADLGEYSSVDELNNEISLIHHITSASIACEAMLAIKSQLAI